MGEKILETRVSRSVSIKRAAELLDVSIRTVYYRIRDGRLETIRAGNSRRVLSESLNTLFFASLEKRKEPPHPKT